MLSVHSCRLLAFQRPPLAAPLHLRDVPSCGAAPSAHALQGGRAARQQLPRFPGARCAASSLRAHAAPPRSDDGSSRARLLLIKGLPASIDEEYLKAIFKAYGTVTWTRMAVSAASGSNSTTSGFVMFADEQAAASALAEMNGAEVCGTDDCTHITVDLSDSQNAGSEMASQRLLSRLHAVKREIRLHKRIENSASATLARPAPPLLPGQPVRAETGSALAAQGRALPDGDVNEKFNDFLNGLRRLLPATAPTAHASLSNVSALGLAPRSRLVLVLVCVCVCVCVCV